MLRQPSWRLSPRIPLAARASLPGSAEPSRCAMKETAVLIHVILQQQRQQLAPAAGFLGAEQSSFYCLKTSTETAIIRTTSAARWRRKEKRSIKIKPRRRMRCPQVKRARECRAPSGHSAACKQVIIRTRFGQIFPPDSAAAAQLIIVLIALASRATILKFSSTRLAACDRWRPARARKSHTQAPVGRLARAKPCAGRANGAARKREGENCCCWLNARTR